MWIQRRVTAQSECVPCQHDEGASGSHERRVSPLSPLCSTAVVSRALRGTRVCRYAKFFAGRPYPARITVGVSALAFGADVEIDAEAAVCESTATAAAATAGSGGDSD